MPVLLKPIGPFKIFSITLTAWDAVLSPILFVPPLMMMPLTESNRLPLLITSINTADGKSIGREKGETICSVGSSIFYAWLGLR